MNDQKCAIFRERLSADLTALATEDDLGREATQTVTLDQQAVGRLSRMDAMQGQAMANATKARRDVQRRRIDAALARLDEGEFGFCLECGDDIAAARLDLDPCVPTCISCASG